jgi:hypothetical protein
MSPRLIYYRANVLSSSAGRKRALVRLRVSSKLLCCVRGELSVLYFEDRTNLPAIGTKSGCYVGIGEGFREIAISSW